MGRNSLYPQLEKTLLFINNIEKIYGKILKAKRKIIFLVKNFFTKRDYDRFSIKFYQENDIDVEIWDITSLLEKKDYEKLIKPYDQIKTDYVKQIDNIQEIEDRLKDLNHKVLVSVHLVYNLQSFKVFRLLSKYKKNFILYGISSPGFLFYRYEDKNFFYKIRYFRKYLNFNFLYNYFINFILRNVNPRIFGINCATYLIVGGAIYLKKKNNLVDKTTKIIWTHQKNYDLFLKNKNNNYEKAGKKYIAFIDQAVPFHNELISMNIKMNAEEYYSSLENFFVLIKEKYNMEVKICAHPRDPDKISKYIKKFVVEKDKTIENIKNCSFVICHDSIAINFAVMYEKPILFIYNNVLENVKNFDHLNFIKRYAKLFKKKPINIDKIGNLDINRELKIDKKCYDEYFKNYIKFKGENKFQCETIKDLVYSL